MMRLQLEVRSFRVIEDLVAPGPDSVPDRTFKVEAGLVGGVAHLDEDSFLVRAYRIEKDGGGPASLNVELALGNGDVASSASRNDELVLPSWYVA